MKNKLLSALAKLLTGILCIAIGFIVALYLCNFLIMPPTQIRLSAAQAGINTATHKGTLKWMAGETLLASTTARRQRAVRELGIDRGFYTLAIFSITCGECERAAREINDSQSNNQIVAVAVASQADIEQWRSRLGLHYPVRSISHSILDDLGAVIFPTVIKISSGKVDAVASYLEGAYL